MTTNKLLSALILPLLLVTIPSLAMAQTDQLYHLQQFAIQKGISMPVGMGQTIDNYKMMLAAQVAVDEIGNDPSHPVNSTTNDPITAHLDSNILSYLCEIDTTYCEGGDNYPLR